MGPSFRWDILNYGRLMNNIHLQEARTFELIAAYQARVLQAAQSSLLDGGGRIMLQPDAHTPREATRIAGRDPAPQYALAERG